MSKNPNNIDDDEKSISNQSKSSINSSTSSFINCAIGKKSKKERRKKKEIHPALQNALHHVKENMTENQKALALLKEAKNIIEGNNPDYIGGIEILNEGISYNPLLVTLYLNRAICFKGLNKWTESYFDYCYAIRIEPETGSHYSLRGHALSKLKRIPMALEDMDIAVKLDPSPLTYLSRAMVYMEGIKYDNAVTDLTRALNDESISQELKVRCLYRRALAYIELKRYDEAIDDLVINLKLDPNHVATRALYAKALKMVLQLGRAEDQLKMVIEMEPNQPSHYLERGDVRYRTGNKDNIIEAIYDFDRGIKILEKKIATEIENAPPGTYGDSNNEYHNHHHHHHVIRGILSTENEELLAELLFKRAQAKLILNTNENLKNEALQDVIKATQYVPDDDEYQVVVAICYIQQEKYQEASEILKKVLYRKPTHEKALFHLAFCNRTFGNKKDAIEGLTKIIASNERNSSKSSDPVAIRATLSIPLHRIFETRATLLHEVQAHKLALADLGNAISMNPDRAELYFMRADCNCKLGNYENALDDFNLAEDKKFSDLRALYSSRGSVHRMLGNSKRAIKDFMKALKLFNSNNKLGKMRTMLLIALAQIDLGKYGSAFDTLTVAQNSIDEQLHKYINPTIIEEEDTNNNQDEKKDETILLQQGEEAIKLLKRVSWVINYHCCLSLSNMHEYESSLEYFNNCTCIENSQYAPDDFSLGGCLFFYSRALVKVGKLDDSMNKLNLLMTTSWYSMPKNQNMTLFSIAKNYQIQKKHYEAIDYFQRSIIVQPDNPHSFFRRAWSYKAIDDFVQAGIDFENAKQLRPGDPNFAVDYRRIGKCEFIQIDSEPDLIEPFLPLLPLAGAW